MRRSKAFPIRTAQGLYIAPLLSSFCRVSLRSSSRLGLMLEAADTTDESDMAIEKLTI